MSPINTLEINAERLWATIERSAEIGRFRDTGLRRLALTAEDKAVRDLFVGWAREAGCTVEVDPVGNIFARRAGTDDSMPPVAIGSHLDSQICGGRYDGVLGVMCGLEAIRTLNDRAIQTRRPIELIMWTNEEGARFSPPLMGSLAFAGKLPVAQVHDTKDDAGLRFGDELERIGYAGKAPLGNRPLDCYLELHIEQALTWTARAATSASSWAATGRSPCASTSGAKPAIPAAHRWASGATPWSVPAT